MNYVKTNPHPTGKKIGDCVVRAIAIAETKKWIDVYSGLCDVGRDIYDMPNAKPTYEAYLLANGWSKNKMPKHATGKRMTVQQLTELVPTGVIIVSITRHLATVVDGVLYDTWDCGNKCVGNYYTK